MKKYILVLITLILFIVMFVPAKADTGWDTDYDSGSSSSSSSSWDSSSSGSSSGFSMTEDDGDIVYFVIFTILFFAHFGATIFLGKALSKNMDIKSKTYKLLCALLVILLIFSPVLLPLLGIESLYLFEVLATFVVAYFLNNNSGNEREYVDVSLEELNKFGINDINALKDELYNKFVTLQEAWMNFNYDSIRSLCTDELYNTYKSQLDVLNLKNGKNIMKDFRLFDIKIIDIKSEGNDIKMMVYLQVSFYDYVIDKGVNKNGHKVVRGNKNLRVTNTYILTFVKSKLDVGSKTTCPNCGNIVHINASGECEYCHSVIVNKTNEFVLSEKKIIKQE